MLLSIPEVLDAAQLDTLRARLGAADWADGRITAGHQSAQAKDNAQLPEDSAIARDAGALVLEALSRSSTFFSAVLPRRIYPPLFNRYSGGQSFGYHVDNAVRYDRSRGGAEPVRTDVSGTLFLSDPDSYDGGELLVIAPGLKRFGEQPEVDTFIRKYGYVGTPRVMDLYRRERGMQDLAHAAAHLMHGSSEGRFKITYAPGHLPKRDIESVNFGYSDINEATTRYRPDKCKQGWNTTADGERYYFIPTPSAGLWATREKLFNRASGFAND